MEKILKKSYWALASWCLLFLGLGLVSGPVLAGVEAASADEVRLAGKTADGWEALATGSFRVFHYGSARLAEKLARLAERTRRQVESKWFGKTGPEWNPPCHLYLYNSGSDYSHYTGLPSGLPGYATIQEERGRILGRRIDLNGGNADFLEAVLPHEVTHICMWSRLGKEVPIWANEGLAVLTEPRDRIDRHLRNLPRHRQNRELYALPDLISLKSYPEPRYLGAFYAQSISLVKLMAELKGPRIFAEFLRDAMHDDFEPALGRHYKMKMRQLEGSWRQRALGPALDHDQ